MVPRRSAPTTSSETEHFFSTGKTRRPAGSGCRTDLHPVTITGQDNLTWLYDFAGTGTASGNQTTNLTGVHTSTPVGTSTETFSSANTTSRAKIELTDQYQISDGTTQVTGTLSVKSSAPSGTWDQTDGTGSYVFDTAHPGSLTVDAKPASGSITFQSKSGGSVATQTSDSYTFQSQLLDDKNAKIGTASGSSTFTASDSTTFSDKSSGTWNVVTDTGTMHATDDYTSSGTSTIAVTTNATYTDGSLTYHSGWSSADQSSSKGSSTIDGSFDADGNPILATADFQDDTTITTSAYSAWEDGVISVNDPDGVGKVNHTFSTKISNTTPLIDKSSETYHLVVTTTTGSSGQGGNSSPNQPGGGGSGGSGDATTNLTSGSLVFRYESSGTLQVQSSFSLSYSAAITDDSASGGGSGTPAKVGVTSGLIGFNSIDTAQSTSLTTGSWDLVADKGTVHDVSSYSGTGTSTLSVALNANYDDGSVVYHADTAKSDTSVYSGDSTLDGSFDSEGTPILATSDGNDNLTITTTAYSVHENGVLHTSEYQGQSTSTESFGVTTINLTDLVETAGDSYHLVFDASAAGSGNGGSGDPDAGMGMLPTSGTWGFSSTSAGTTKIDANISRSTSSLLVAPPTGTGSAGSGSRTGISISYESAASTDTVQAATTTSGTLNAASNTTSLLETSSYSGTGSSTETTSYEAAKDDGSLVYHGDTSVASNRVYSGGSKLDGSFNTLGAPVVASLDTTSKITVTTTKLTANENGTILANLDNGATSLTEIFSLAMANNGPMISKATEAYHLEFTGSSSQSGSGGGTGSTQGFEPYIPSDGGSAGQAPSSGGTKPAVATVTFQYETTGSVHKDQSSAGSFTTKLTDANQIKIGQSTGTYAFTSKMDSSTNASLNGTWDLLANKGTVHNSESYDTGEAYTTAVTNRYELTQGGVVYNSGSSSKAQTSFHGESKIDGFIDSQGKQISGTSHTQDSRLTNTSELNSWESYQATGQPTWTKSQTADRIEEDHSTLDLAFASDGRASGTSTGSSHSVLHAHDLSSWVGTQLLFDSSNAGGSTATQIGTIVANDHGDDSQTVIGDSTWNLTYANDVPHGDRASTVQVTGTTLWTTDHTLILNQNGHTEYKTTGEDKTAFTGTDVILYHDDDGKTTGSRHMSVANQESHQLTIDGTGQGIGFEGASGDWKYHYQSLDLVNDTDTKDFSLTNATWSEASHTFRTDHQGSSSWTYTQGQSYNTVPNPMNGFWQTQISNVSMGGSNSYHDLKWGDSNSFQFNQNRNGSYNKNSNGSGGYGFGGAGSTGTSASNSVETSSFHDNRSGSTVNGVTTYSYVDIATLAEKTSWNESSDKNGQTVQYIRSDDWSRDEMTVLGNSNSLTTTKINAFNRVQTYAYSGTGTLPEGGTSSQTGNQTTSNTATGSGTVAALGVINISNNPGKPGNNPATQNYVDANANSYRNGGPPRPNGGNAPTGFPQPAPPMALMNLFINSPQRWNEIREKYKITNYSEYYLSMTGIVNGQLTPIATWGSHSIDYSYAFSDSQIDAMLSGAQNRIDDELRMNSRNNYVDPIDKLDGFVAGWSDKLTFGGSTYLRGAMYGDTATKNHQGAYFTAGQFVGTVHSFALGGAAGATGKAGYWAIQTANWYSKLDTAAGIGGVVYKAFFDPASLSVWDGLNFTPLAGFGLSKLVGLGKAKGFLPKDFCIAGLFGCFPAGTKVTTVGGLKPIEEIQVGDEVKAYDFVNNEWAIRKVGKTFKRAYFGGLVSAQIEGVTIESTFHHPFWIVRGKELETRRLLDHLPPVPEGCQTEGRWVDACDMRVGDEVLLADGRIIPIERISYSPFEGDVYNLQVQDLHCYAAGSSSVLVHNSYSDSYSKWWKSPGGVPKAGSSHPSLPDRTGGGPTSGLFNDTKPLMSGADGGEALKVFGSQINNLSKEAKIALKHVEGHAAAEMIKNNLMEAILHINYKTGPCQFCRDGVSDLLREGQKLWVVFPDGIGFFTTSGWFRL